MMMARATIRIEENGEKRMMVNYIYEDLVNTSLNKRITT